MKIKSLFTIALAATTLFSCSKDGEDVKIPSGKTQSVSLRIVQQDAPGTYAEAPGVAAGTSPVLSAGFIFFADATTITDVLTISAGPTSPTNLDIAELTSLAGATAVNVSDASTQIFILSNLPTATNTAAAALGAGSTVAALKALAVDVVAMGNAAGDVTAVPLYGEGTITPGVPPLNSTATVQVGAIASRIEITKISADPAAVPAKSVTDFELVGIYINNYYRSQGIGGSLITPSTLTDNGNTQAHYDLADPLFAYASPLEPLYDNYSPAKASNAANEVELAGSDVWAYNVFPAKNDPLVPTDDNLPHIVLVLDNVEVNGVAQTGKRYITLAAYKAGVTPVEEFKKAVVYTIGNIEFDADDLNVTPETKQMDVEVTVQYINWTTQAIEWDN